MYITAHETDALLSSLQNAEVEVANCGNRSMREQAYEMLRGINALIVMNTKLSVPVANEIRVKLTQINRINK